MSSLFDLRQCSGKCGVEIQVDKLSCQRCWLEVPVKQRNALSKKLVVSRHSPPWRDPELVKEVIDAIRAMVEAK